MANSNGWGDGASNNNIGWGKGADNAIGWGDIHADSWAGATDIVGTPAVDPDAQAFITAASITDPTQQSAINTLVTDLKGYGVWTKMKALYPFVGGTAAQHKWNLKDPRDLDAAFRLVFNGGWTHSSSGIIGNNTNSFADTKFNPNSAFSTNDSAHLSLYSRINSASSSYVDFGATDTTGKATALNSAFTNSSLSLLHNASTGISTSNTNTQGFYVGSRTTSAIHKLFKGGVQIGSTDTTSAGTRPNLNLYLGAYNVSNSALYHTNRNYAFASIGDGLTDTEAANFYTAVQAFQTTLGRSIGTQTVSDADAQAFVTNAGIVDQVEANAVNNLVIGLKADGLWTKMKACYPMVGGSNTSTSYNLRNTAQYQISWAGGVTSSANGVTFGVNGYGNTGLNPTTDLTLSDTHLSFYSRTDGTGGIDIGATAASDTRNLFIAQSYVGNFYADSYSSQARFMLANQTKGLMTITRTASNSFKAFKNATQIGTTITSQPVLGTLPNWNIFLGATNRDGAPTNPTAYSARNQAFATIGTGLTDTDVTNLNTRVTTFQTALNRNV